MIKNRIEDYYDKETKIVLFRVPINSVRKYQYYQAFKKGKAYRCNKEIRKKTVYWRAVNMAKNINLSGVTAE